MEMKYDCSANYNPWSLCSGFNILLIHICQTSLDCLDELRFRAH